MAWTDFGDGVKHGSIWQHGEVVQRFEDGELIAWIPGLEYAFFLEVKDEDGYIIGYQFDGLVEDWEDGLDLEVTE